jgi:hypothetical protein
VEGTQPPGNDAYYLFGVTGPSQVTVSIGTEGLFTSGSTGFVSDHAVIQSICGGPGTMPVGYCSMTSGLLPSGLYQIDLQHSGNEGLQPVVTIEPPFSTAANTTCATATPIALGTAFTEQRVVTGGDRFYSLTTTGTNLNLSAKMLSPFGQMTATLYSNCFDPTTKVGGFTYTLPSFAPTSSTQLPGLPPGKYWLDISNIQPGTIYQLVAQ